jgi:hypothetical protein
MRLIILIFLYFIVVMWLLMWTTCMPREFIIEFLLYSYRECLAAQVIFYLELIYLIHDFDSCI